ncbi:MAG: RsmE family RNA methyltransferase [Candidatus Eisenbacteria bacterium]
MAESAAARFAHPFGQPVTQVVIDDLALETLRIEGDDARHLAASLRLAVGDTFVATDGRGRVARLEASAISRRGVEARVLERARVPAPELRLWLVADAEGARGDWIVEKAVEFGAFGFLPARAARPGRVDRWRRVARAALKQSLSAYELRIEADRPALEVAGARAAAPQGGFGVWIAHPNGADPLLQELVPQGDLFLVCGPPGGFSTADLGAWEALPAACRVGLGELRLRAESAALMLLAAAALRRPPAARGPETA